MKDLYDIYEYWYCKNDIGPVEEYAAFFALLEELAPDERREEVFQKFFAVLCRMEFAGFLNGIQAGRGHVTADGRIVIQPEA